MSHIYSKIKILPLVVLVLLPALLTGQFDIPDDLVELSTKWSTTATVKGQSAQFAVQLEVSDKWHINSNEPLEDFLIPTEVTFEAPEGVTIGRIYYPEAELYQFDFSEEKVAVYEGTVNLITSVSVDESFTGDEVTIDGILTYQACNNTSCLPPQEQSFTATLSLVDDAGQSEAINSAIFESYDQPGAGSAQPVQESQIASWMSERGMFFTLLLIFIGGLALNLTPCVYPLIPITVSYFGGQAKKSDNIKSTFTLAIFYVLGMALTYSLLGTVAALTGQMLGAALQNPIVLGFIAAILVALAASMFGAFEIQVPQSLASIGGKSRQGLVGSLFMGLTVGIIAAPCIGPFVLSLLIFVGDLGNPWLGFLMFFTLSLGLGLPYLLLGTFSGLIKKLPRSGQWMVWVRYVFGFILIGMAIYFLEPVLSDTMYRVLFGLDALAAAIFLGVISWKKTDTKAFKVVKPITGLLFLAIGIWISVPAQSETEGIEWTQYSEEHLQEAVQSGTPVIIDFYADWCLPCKELDKFTFTDAEVKSEAQNFVTLKADLTQNNSPEVQQLKEEYDIRGVPTIVFLNEEGEEIPSLRLTGFESAGKFLQRMNQVTGTQQNQLSANNLQENNDDK